MSQRDATVALNRMNMRAALIAPQYTGFATDLRSLALADATLEQDDAFRRRGELCQAYGFTTAADNKPFAFSNGIAIIPVQGTMINRFSYSWGFVTGYNFIRQQLAAAIQDDDVIGIAFDVNTYGGEAAGCFELCEDIFNARGKKPMAAFVDSNCYSAGYAIASSADQIIVTPSGGAGSIGVCMMHCDLSKALAEEGVAITFIFAGDHKVDGNPYEPLPPAVKASMQADVDASRDEFVALVARNRGMDSQKVLDTQAQCYRAEDALSLGLIDGIMAPSEAMMVFFNELSGSTDESEQELHAMTPEEKQEHDAALATARKEAATAERTRMAGIIGSDEAKGKSKLANHLASNTEMSVEDAKALLQAAAPEVTSADPVAPKAKEEAAAPNAFQAAMDASEQPKVGAGKEGMAESAKGANRLLSSHKKATGGFKPKAA